MMSTSSRSAIARTVQTGNSAPETFARMSVPSASDAARERYDLRRRRAGPGIVVGELAQQQLLADRPSAELVADALQPRARIAVPAMERTGRS